MYVHSIPNNNDNQDIVSMGTNAAMLTRQVVENGYQVAAIEMLALVQAADYLQCAGELSDATRQLYADIRGIVPRFADDTPKHREIAAIENFLKTIPLPYEKLLTTLTATLCCLSGAFAARWARSCSKL